jgi:hypothetical protein
MLSDLTVFSWPVANAIFSVDGDNVRGRQQAIVLLSKKQQEQNFMAIPCSVWDSQFQEWIGLATPNFDFKKFKRQIRDRLNKCFDLEKLEKIEKILG